MKVGFYGKESINALHLQKQNNETKTFRIRYIPIQKYNTFYVNLNFIVTIPKHDQLVILGDFNARVESDHNVLTTWLMNLNNQHLLKFCDA